MADIFSKQKRSAVMAAIRSRGNRSTELRMMALMRLAQVKGWRRNYRLFGRPDFVFPKRRIALFVDGDFWHGNRERARIPAANRAYWRRKIAANIARDRLVNRRLRKLGWRVVRVWEHDLARSRQARVARRLQRLFF